MRPEASTLSFVRALLGGEVATRRNGLYVLPGGRRADGAVVRALISAGAIAGSDRECTAGRETRAWLKRALLDADNLAAQHRTEAVSREGVTTNLAESPLMRLCAATGGPRAFLDRHHLEAGERVRRLVERAGLQPRLTMTYAADRVAGSGAAAHGDISDLAADARKELARIHDALPVECAGVVVDVCGWLKGLQEVERDRGWPRRSAKLVLRIGLEQVARHYGLGPFATGAETRRSRRWMEDGARPTEFGSISRRWRGPPSGSG